MRNRIFAVILLIVLLLPTASALSENRQIEFSYSVGKEKKKLEWGSSIEELQDMNINGISERSNFLKVQLPFWSDTSKLTSQKCGYESSTNNADVKFYGVDIRNVKLYYVCQFDEKGVVDDKSLAQLYMIELGVSILDVNDNKIRNMLNNLSNAFGKPRLNETFEQGYITYIGNGGFYNGPYKKYHRIYTWSGADKTGMRLSLDYTDFNKSYENISIVLGKTNMDAILKKGKTSALVIASASQVTVEKKTIALRDKNKKTIGKLEVGTVLQIVGYDKDLNMFAAIVVTDHSNVEEKAAKGSIDGYVYGDNLSVNRAELLEEYKD
ncbi:MAG: hypothetical protein IJI53_10085 [Clostridia bacterium]|nr:hypothetical protein [Clostridia bacterium]